MIMMTTTATMIMTVTMIMTTMMVTTTMVTMTRTMALLIAIKRMVATWPPPEAGEPEGTVWVLEVYAYGLAEAPKEWNATIHTFLISMNLARAVNF